MDCYYKAPCALAFAGERSRAGRLFDYAIDRFLLPGGDLDGAGVAWFDRFRTYPHSWLCWAAVELNRPQAAARLSAFLATRWNPSSGGFRADAQGAEEIMTTSMAGLACLLAGNRDIAHGVARWLDTVFSAQPDLQRGLIHVCQPGLGLTAGDGSVSYIVDASRPRQWYFQYGISAAFLAAYVRAGGSPAALQLARNYLLASRFCFEDVYRTPQSGKIGWGAAWTFALSREPSLKTLAETVATNLCQLQCGDGSWNPEGVYEPVPQSETAVRIDVTAEFVALLSQMGESLRD